MYLLLIKSSLFFSPDLLCLLTNKSLDRFELMGKWNSPGSTVNLQKHSSVNPSFPQTLKVCFQTKTIYSQKGTCIIWWRFCTHKLANGPILKREHSHLCQKLANSSRLLSKGHLKHPSSFPPPPPPQHNILDPKLPLISCQHSPEICSVPGFSPYRSCNTSVPAVQVSTRSGYRHRVF